MPPCSGSKAHQSPADSTSSRRVMIRAMRLALRSSPSRMGTTPANGSNTRAWRIHRSNEIEASNWLMGWSRDHGVEHPEHASQEQDDVHPDLPCLQPAAEPSQAPGEPGGSIDRRSIDHTL